MRIMLAPMEGVVDATMRDFLTRIGGYDRCVTEFVRVVDQVYPRRVFTRICPELLTDGHTASGTPVYLQLLGSDLTAMAGNARKAAKLGALGIDINFGCPSRIVNSHDGGAAVLREPQRVGEIAKAVRDAVPVDTPVTAKIRLGFDNADGFAKIVEAIKASGVNELCVHARTKTQGYKPPAYWSSVALARQNLDIPVVINGEIWSPETAQHARTQSQCDDIMLGRGAIACPDLAKHIRAKLNDTSFEPMTWEAVWEKVREQALTMHAHSPNYAACRTKQWLVYLKGHYADAVTLFDNVKRCKSVTDMVAIADGERSCGKNA